MTTNDTALVRQGQLTDDQIRLRIQLNKKSGWGLEKGTDSQLHQIFVVCQKFGLLPGDDLTLYEGKPWITIDGRVKLMRRHPSYAGYSTRPLSKAEKVEWGYAEDDIVIECAVRTVAWGVITARGKVTRAEIEGRQMRGNPVAKLHPVEMAEKRAISRAERLAFGADAVLEDEEVEHIVTEVAEQQADPERTRMLAAQQSAIFGSDDEGTAFADLPAERGELVEDEA